MKREQLEALVGKKVMFSGTKQKQGVFYYDATIKKIGDHFFLKYNRPNYDIFDNDIHVDKQKRAYTIAQAKAQEEAQAKAQAKAEAKAKAKAQAKGKEVKKVKIVKKVKKVKIPMKIKNLSVKDIMKAIDKNLSNSYKCSYEVSVFDRIYDNDNRYTRITKLNGKNITEELKGCLDE